MKNKKILTLISIILIMSLTILSSITASANFTETISDTETTNVNLTYEDYKHEFRHMREYIGTLYEESTVGTTVPSPTPTNPLPIVTSGDCYVTSTSVTDITQTSIKTQIFSATDINNRSYINNALSFDDEVKSYRQGDNVIVVNGVVDLGTLTWNYVIGRNSTKHMFQADISGIYNRGGANVARLLCDAFSADSYYHVYDNVTDNTISLHQNGNCIDVYCSSYPDATAFETEMSGVKLYYQLATPITIPIQTSIQDLEDITIYNGGTTITITDTTESPDYHVNPKIIIDDNIIKILQLRQQLYNYNNPTGGVTTPEVIPVEDLNGDGFDDNAYTAGYYQGYSAALRENPIKIDLNEDGYDDSSYTAGYNDGGNGMYADLNHDGYDDVSYYVGGNGKPLIIDNNNDTYDDNSYNAGRTFGANSVNAKIDLDNDGYDDNSMAEGFLRGSNATSSADVTDILPKILGSVSGFIVSTTGNMSIGGITILSVISLIILAVIAIYALKVFSK